MNVIEETAGYIRKADTILFITGAGISAESGLPTYRGVGGLYEDSETEDGIPIEAALSGDMLKSNPELTWKYLWQIGSVCCGASPNRAHEIIRLIQRHNPNTWVMTQNVDGLHRKAGTANLIEMHGHAFDLYCTLCGKRYTLESLFPNIEKAPKLPPRCRQLRCSGIVRPDVVLFGEYLPLKAQNMLQEVLDRRPDIVISIGTSSTFPYITAPIFIPGITTVEINPVKTVISKIVTFRIAMRAVEAMEQIWKVFEGMV